VCEALGVAFDQVFKIAGLSGPGFCVCIGSLLKTFALAACSKKFLMSSGLMSVMSSAPV
jgi:hypothetical protein